MVVAIILVVAIVIDYRTDTGSIGLVSMETGSMTSKNAVGLVTFLGVLAIPVVVGFGAVWFTTRQGKVADAENKDNQRETALQAYIDKMSELLLHEKLRDSAKEDEVRNIARVRTLTILPLLDGNRKSSLLKFLYETGRNYSGLLETCQRAASTVK